MHDRFRMVNPNTKWIPDIGNIIKLGKLCRFFFLNCLVTRCTNWWKTGDLFGKFTSALICLGKFNNNSLT